MIKKYCKNSIWTLCCAFVVLLVLNYVRSLMPLFISKIFEVIGYSEAGVSTLPSFLNKMFEGKDISAQILIVFLGICGVGFLRDTLNLADDVLIAISGENIGYNLQTDFYEHVQSLPYSYLNRCETGDLIQRATNDISRVKNLLGNQMPEILNNLMKLFIYSAQMLIISPKLGGIIVAFIPFILILGIVHNKIMRPTFEKFEKNEGELTTVVQENLTGIRVVKAFANEDLEVKKEKKKMDEFAGVWRKMMDVNSIYWSTGDLFGYFLMLLAFALGIKMIQRGEISLSQVIAVMLYVNMIIWPARFLGRLFSEISRTNIAAGRVMEIIEMPSEYDIADGDKKPEIKGNIEFKDVKFQFGDAKTPTIDGITFNVKQGQTVAIIGKTGCGKSTFASLLNRMLEISGGDIIVDGVPIKEINKKHLRKHVGLVLQESFLFSNTIAENIGISREKVDLKEIQLVAEVANVNGDILKFNDGYDTIVGERGVTLSGGQKQRISIARTILEHKPILVFDDSLSAVDTETDIKIRKALKGATGKSTTFIITHRVVTAKDADLIIVMDDGKVTNMGTHEELLNQEGLYKNIWTIQNYFEEGEVGNNG